MPMNVQFTHPMYLLLLPPALAWVVWLAWKSDVQISQWRRWLAFLLRTAIVTCWCWRSRGCNGSGRARA